MNLYMKKLTRGLSKNKMVPAEMLKIISLSLAALLLSACATAPTRLNTEAFKVVQEGRVPIKNTQAFTDCLMDGFDEAHFIGTNIIIRQQRRSDSYRVEALTGVSLLVSAEVFDDGRVRLHESSIAALIITEGERHAFEKCLKHYGIAER